MARVLLLLVCSIALLPHRATAEDGHRGWGYLVGRLVADGVPRDRVVAVFDDPRLEPFTGLGFGLHSREPASLYRSFRRPSSIAAARRCRAEHADVLADGERLHGVPASLVAAILHVETGCGRNTGSSPVFYRLARLAMANEPENRHANLLRLVPGGWHDEAFAERVAVLREVAAVLGEMRVEDRLRARLHLLAQRLGRTCREGVRIPLELTHAQWALLVGASRESVTLAFGRLREGGEVRIEGRVVTLTWQALGQRPPQPAPA
jgi:hypothetical protein